MSTTLTEQGVRQIISTVVERVCADDLGASEDFYVFGFDSLDHAQILMRIEEVFGLQIAEDDVEHCRSIDAIIEYAARPIQPAC